MLNFMIAKHFKFHKARLTEELYESLDKIKLAISTDIDKSENQNEISKLELWKLIDFDLFFQNISKKINYFENIGYDLVKQACSFHEELFTKHKIIAQQMITHRTSDPSSECDDSCTDFLSDTEVHFMSKKKKFNKKWSISKLKKWSKKSTNNKFDSLGEESLIDIDESNCKYSDASYSDSELDNIPIPNYSCLKKYELLNHFDSLLNNPENKSAYHRGRRQAHVKFPRSISSETSSTDPSTVNGSEATQNCNDEDDYKVSYDDFESDSSSNVSIVTIEDDDYESANLFDNPSICIENIDQMEEGPEKSTDARDKNIEDSDDCIILEDEPPKSSYKMMREYENRNQIKVGMEVLALKDKFRNMWQIGQIVRIDGK